MLTLAATILAFPQGPNVIDHAVGVTSHWR